MYFSENQIFPTGFLMSAYSFLGNKLRYYINDILYFTIMLKSLILSINEKN
jgi:hypothetical protein